MIFLKNAQIYTLDAQYPVVHEMIIDHGRIMATGLKNTLDPLWSRLVADQTQGSMIDLAGRVILPGFVDAHIHLEQYAIGLEMINCETESRRECLLKVDQKVSTTPEGSWILGHGWNQNNWSEGFGDRYLLDQVAPNHPVYLTAKSLHAGWANSLALRIAGLHDGTPDPADGKIGRDNQGALNGILFEGAMKFLAAAIPEISPANVAENIFAAQQVLWQMGVTGVHDFDRKRCFTALQQLYNSDRLQIRVVKSIPLEDLSAVIDLGIRTGFGNDFLRIGSIKLFADGALGPRTAAMLQPYEFEPENRGMTLIDEEEIVEHGKKAVANGLSLAVHAIGDRANHEVLRAYRQLRIFERELASASGDFVRLNSLRHRIEHVQVIHPEEIQLLAELGIIASMQPIHALSDMQMADTYWGERAKYSYAWKSQLSSGAALAFGSDAPVDSPNPWWGIYAAVTRKRIDGYPGNEGWYPEQKISLLEAIQAYTTGPAFTAGTERYLGKIKENYLADLQVLDVDPFTTDPDQLDKIHPSAVMIGGKWVVNNLV